jgi:type IV secretory pathway VirB10-like protein
VPLLDGVGFASLACEFVVLATLCIALNSSLRKQFLLNWNTTRTKVRTRHPTPDTRHPTPDTRHPTPDTRHPTPDIRHPTPDTRHPTPDTRTPNPEPRTRARAPNPNPNPTKDERIEQLHGEKERLEYERLMASQKSSRRRRASGSEGMPRSTGLELRLGLANRGCATQAGL